MDKLAQEDHSYCPSSEEYERYKKNWYISLNKSGRNAPMKLRSDFREALTSMHRLHRESREERPEPIPFNQYRRWHSSSSSSSTSWWRWNENWWSSFFFNGVARSFTADSNLLQPTGVCEQNTLTRHIFLVFLRTHDNVSHDIGSRLKVLVRVIPSMCHAPLCLISLRLSLRTLHLSLPYSTSSP